MEELLVQMIGKKVDIGFVTSAVYRGDIVALSGGVVQIKDVDAKVINIAIDKIATLCECDDNQHKLGFVNK